ncbi:hypothetical protein TNIN_122441 [Trichonephila inaurata madagascariensis]|uniref:Uncharacterized protein n=1 Tax=Trichonephila inaurata madagascariensis TaxID=2747483 RepID=A0A8X7C8Y5_9ARAC|nr:hypothetical protein TNIN_122441 [Trichonephila inaurata madagascariensis]
MIKLTVFAEFPFYQLYSEGEIIPTKIEKEEAIIIRFRVRNSVVVTDEHENSIIKWQATSGQSSGREKNATLTRKAFLPRFEKSLVGGVRHGTGHVGGRGARSPAPPSRLKEFYDGNDRSTRNTVVEIRIRLSVDNNAPQLLCIARYTLQKRGFFNKNLSFFEHDGMQDMFVEPCAKRSTS